VSSKGEPLCETVVQFTYDPRRSAVVPTRLFSGLNGALTTEIYNPYITVAETRRLTHLSYRARARCKFVDTKKAQSKGRSGKVDKAINLIAMLYSVESQNRLSDAVMRHPDREQISVPVLEKIMSLAG